MSQDSLTAQLVRNPPAMQEILMIPGSGRSTGEGICYPLQYSWTSLVTQLPKNLPAMRETWVQPLGWEDLLEKGKAAHTINLENSMGCIVHGVAKSETQLSDFQFSSRVRTVPTSWHPQYLK